MTHRAAIYIFPPTNLPENTFGFADNQLPPFGARITLAADAHLPPSCVLKKGATGTVLEASPKRIRIRMDDFVPTLEEGNELHLNFNAINKIRGSVQWTISNRSAFLDNMSTTQLANALYNSAVCFVAPGDSAPDRIELFTAARVMLAALHGAQNRPAPTLSAQFAAEYTNWLYDQEALNRTVPSIISESSGEDLSALRQETKRALASLVELRSEEPIYQYVANQIAWLEHFVARQDQLETARAICQKWVAKLSFHFDSNNFSGDYKPPLQSTDIAEYDIDIEVLQRCNLIDIDRVETEALFAP